MEAPEPSPLSIRLRKNAVTARRVKPRLRTQSFPNTRVLQPGGHLSLDILRDAAGGELHGARLLPRHYAVL